MIERRYSYSTIDIDKAKDLLLRLNLEITEGMLDSDTPQTDAYVSIQSIYNRLVDIIMNQYILTTESA